MRLAVYDMDLTITGRASWTPFLVHFALTERPWRLLLAPLLLLPLAAFALRLIGRAGLKQATQRIMLGRRVPRAVVERAATRFARQFGARHERPAALADLEARRAEGARLLLATASPRFYAEALARRWGMDAVVATENWWDGDLLTPRIRGENCYSMGKLRMLLAHIGARPGHVRCASDHGSDLPLLLWADEAVAVSPSPALRQQALARGWPVVEWAAPSPTAGGSAAPDRSRVPAGTP